MNESTRRRSEKTGKKPSISVLAFLGGLVALGCSSTGSWLPAGAEVAPTEEAAILEVIDRFLVAMAGRDAEAYADLVTPDGMTYTQRQRDGEWTLLTRSNRHHIDALASGASVLNETYWEPTVLIRGPIAVVWTPYEFRIDGEVSHCGVDVFEMLKIEGRWMIGNAMWTVEPEACDELRPTQGAGIRPAELAIP
jgi:hypothetical protein